MVIKLKVYYKQLLAVLESHMSENFEAQAQPANLEPKLNLLNLAGSLGNLFNLVQKLSDPATLAQLEADGKLSLADVQQLMADAQKAAADLSKTVADLQAALGV
jgi:hypothetical protein